MKNNKMIITLDGYKEVTKLLKKLKKEKEHWVEEKKIAAEQGDRSENAEYQGAKENIRRIDKQLYKLKYIVEQTRAVDTSKRTNIDIVLFGATVKLLKSSYSGEEEICIKLLGTHELVYMQKTTDCLCISNISPVGSQLLRKEVGDEIEINNFTYEVLEILG